MIHDMGRWAIRIRQCQWTISITASVHAIPLLLLLRFYCAGQRSTPHYRTLEVRPGRIKLELKYDYDCERDDTNSLLGVLMFGWDVVIVNNE